VQGDGIGGQRRACCIIGGQLAHAHADQTNGALGRRGIDGGHRRDGFSLVAHLVACQGVLAARDRQHAEGLRAVGPSQHRLHAGQPFCL
jgi:hypothetical protein